MALIKTTVEDIKNVVDCKHTFCPNTAVRAPQEMQKIAANKFSKYDEIGPDVIMFQGHHRRPFLEVSICRAPPARQEL